MLSRADTGTVECWNRSEWLTDAEWEYCEGRRRADEHVAARVLLKALVLDALDLIDKPAPRGDEGLWPSVGVVREADEPPALELSARPEREALQRGWGETHVSMSHTASLVSAVLVVELLPNGETIRNKSPQSADDHS